MDVPEWFTQYVSRETLAAFDHFLRLVEKWNKTINLVSPTTLEVLQGRHLWDSAQVYRDYDGRWIDLGSGGGFPGIVIAILRTTAKNKGPTVLIESDTRKCTFLRACIRELSLDAQVVAGRIEEIEKQKANIISARALAPLERLFEFSDRHTANKNTLSIFPKGENWKQEIAKAEEKWRFSFDALPSKTNPDAAILIVRELTRV